MTLPDQKSSENQSGDAGADRVIWTIWLIIAVISIGLLPLTTRGMEIARAVASFCGYSL
ncbi:MAG: hypothetical protein ACPHW3_00915 [Candidatus Puniceispirillales bacterium]|nr:hypothetical protein [Pseudomonadota bacterium]